MQRVLLLMVASLFAFACSDSNTDGTAGEGSSKFLNEVVSCEEVRNQLEVNGSEGLTFTARIIAGDDWCSFSPRKVEVQKTGKVPSGVFVYFSKNTAAAREVKVEVLYSNGLKVIASFLQEEYTTSASYDRQWAEQPEYRADDKLTYKTYYTKLNNGAHVRNFSICYDERTRLSHWVAYPMHYCYTKPNVGRADTFGFDPNDQMPFIPEGLQQNVTRSYGSAPGTGRGYDRGHQCASADRQSNFQTNNMTYYATNMMPQYYTFNQGIWAKLEGKVRDNIVADTLYVVTGTYGNLKTIKDCGGHTVVVPSHCWKVLLRTKRGNTKKAISDCTADELQGIGFWFENKGYPKDKDMPSLTGFTKSIAEIEQLTGFTFFRNMKPEAAKLVKKQNEASAWNIR